MGYIQVIVAVLALGREIFAWLKEREKNAKEKARKIVALRQSLRKARVDGDTSDIERAFSDIGIELSNSKEV